MAVCCTNLAIMSIVNPSWSMVSAPVRSLMQPCQRFLIKAQDYGHRNFNNKTKDQQTLYEKGAGGESWDKPSAPYRYRGW